MRLMSISNSFSKSFAFFIILLIASVVVFSGCIKKESLDPTHYISKRTIDTNISALEDYQNLNKCQILYCLNSSGSVLTWVARVATLGIYDPKPSLYGGRCWVEGVDPYTIEGQKRLNATLTGETDEFVRSFMIGAGPNFAAADEAQRFCGGDLGFATQWLGGSTTQPPRGISKEDVKTVLKSNILPLFAYQNPADGGQYTKSISFNVSEIGPVLIAPGAFYSVSQGATNTADPSSNFQIVKETCSNCFTVALIDFNDVSTIEHYNNTIQNNKFKDYVDIIGYRINLNAFNCDKERIALAISDFTQNISETWKKPSMLVYIDSIEKGDCTKDNITRVYDYIYSQIPIFVAQGLLGMGINDTAKLFDDNGILNIPGRAWFSNCQSYYNLDNPDEVMQVWLMFPEGGDKGFSPCSTLTAASISLLAKCDLNYSNVSIPMPIDSNLSVGDFCFSDTELNTDSHIDFDTNIANVLDSYEKYCELWSPAVRQFSNEFNFDPSLVRSIIHQENGFVPYTAAMKTGSECKSCSSYAGRAYEICCGTETLSYYYQEIDKTWDLSGAYSRNTDYAACGGELAWAKLYFAVYGYIYGRNSLDSHIRAHLYCINNAGCPDKNTSLPTCPFSFSDTKAKNYVSGARTMRDVCRICTSSRATSISPSWTTQIQPLPLIKPFKNSECILPFRTNMGLYWGNGIVIKDMDGENTVRSVLDGKVVAVEEKLIRGKTVSIESQASGGLLTTTYSHLSSIAVNNGDIVTVKQKIGEVDNDLMVEMCSGSNCLDPSQGINRNFLDPSKYLNINCTDVS